MLNRIYLAVALFFVTAAILFAPLAANSFAFNDENGKKVYEMYCAQCHGEDGRPLTSDIPDFTRRNGMMKPDPELLGVIYNGVGVMPGYRGIISDNDIRDVLDYIKFNF